jgi:hypothetical protein
MANLDYTTADYRVISDAPEYVIHRDGTIIRVIARARTSAGKVIKPWILNGYPAVCLRHNEKVLKRLVHRLVCAAFHGPQPSPKHEVAHNDGRPGNPHADNLRWATHRENEADKQRHGTKVRTSAKLSEDQVRAIRAAPKYRGVVNDLARQYGVVHQTISDIRRGKNWSSLI